MSESAFWNNLAEEYAAKPVDDPDAYERKLQYMKRSFGPEDVVVDYGCGTGTTALWLAPHVGEAHGVDFASTMIEIAQRKAADSPHDNVHFHVGSIESFDHFEEGRLDGVMANSLLHLVADRPLVLRQLFQRLRPGGTFLSSTVVLGNSWVPYRILLTVMRWLGKAPPVSIVSTDALVAEIRAAGFVDVRVVDVGTQKIVAFVEATRPE